MILSKSARFSAFACVFLFVQPHGVPIADAAATSGNRNCKNTGSFSRWMKDFRREARQQGISQRVINRALNGVTLDRSVIRIDRRQNIFALSFLEFARRLVSADRLRRGPAMIKRHQRIFNRVEKRYGVPAAVITAFWGLESDFGTNMGNRSSLRSLATLAYDCRRPELFRRELLSALRIVQRGDLRPGEMIGSWAGELGQTQFLPSHYLAHAVDFDGDGRRNLLKSVPDLIASSAAYIVHIGWKRGQPWLEEVEVTRPIKWKEADLAIKHPRRRWATWGIKRRGGRSLPGDNLRASLLLPMGRNGPAFLAYENFDVYTEWNNSLVYATTAAYYATRLAGARRVRKPRVKIRAWSHKDMQQLQRLLVKNGFDVGGVDGKLGAKTRGAVKAVQLRYGFPADSYPTLKLLARLRRNR